MPYFEAQKAVTKLNTDDPERKYKVVYLRNMKAFIEVWEGQYKIGEL